MTRESVLSGLWPPFANAVREFLSLADQAGVPVTLVSGYRSMTEQAALYRLGRTLEEVRNPTHKRGQGGSVTDAPPGQSAHNYGLAVDLDSPQLTLVMQAAAAFGFGVVSWDPDHIEWPGWRQLVGLNR